MYREISKVAYIPLVYVGTLPQAPRGDFRATTILGYRISYPTRTHGRRLPLKMNTLMENRSLEPCWYCALNLVSLFGLFKRTIYNTLHVFSWKSGECAQSEGSGDIVINNNNIRN